MAVYEEMRGRVALVTGGSSGIGLATARAFARQGTRVIIASRAAARGKAAEKALAKDGDVVWREADVADSGGRAAPIGKMTEEAWRKTLDGYLTSTFLCMTAEVEAMKRGGVIVNNASVDGLRGFPFPGGAAYAAAKHGVVGLTRSAALERARSGPRIVAICPGWIDTPPVANWMKRDKAIAAEIQRQTPRGRIGDPDEIADAVLWLCSDGASFAVGTVLAVDGGYMA